MMQSSCSRWSGVLKSTSAMTKMTVEPVHRRSCANSSALPVQLVWKRADVPCSGSGSPTLGVLPPETARKQPGEPPKIDLHGVDGVEEARDRDPLAHPYYAPENGNYAIPLCSWKRAIMLRLCSDYAAYKPSYKMEFTYKFTYILISTGFLCGYERHRPIPYLDHRSISQ